ncbi:MAG: deoxyribose-phosphate aldolase [Chloroflexota bacterium]
MLTPEQLAHLIDHTILKPEATPAQVIQTCNEARQYSFASVCVNPVYVHLCAEQLRGSPVKACTTIGFPLGTTTSEVKAFEARQAVESGAGEVDMVIHVGALKAGNHAYVSDDIAAVVRAAHAGGALVKVIIETCLLTNEEKAAACLLARQAGADFVKTSTGFSTGGATAEDIALMRKTVGPEMGVKASGGVRTLEDTCKMVAAGATRIGTSSGVRLMQEIQEAHRPTGPLQER